MKQFAKCVGQMSLSSKVTLHKCVGQMSLSSKVTLHTQDTQTTDCSV